MPTILKEIFLSLGASKVWINKGQGNNVDIKVWDRNGKLIIVGEILNWSINSLLSKKRRGKMISNLNQYCGNKVLIYTNLNRKHLVRFSVNGISQVKIGYQILPRNYYSFFKKKGQITKRERNSPLIRQDVKSKIQSNLKRRKICI